MSVATRTNLATNPTAASVTGYAAIAGTGGTAALSNQVTAGYSGSNFNRVTWSVATTAVSGGVSYTEGAGVGASLPYAALVFVRSSVVQRVQLRADFRNGSNAVVNTATGAATVLAANTWTQLTVSGTSGAAVTNAVLSVSAVTGTSGVVWPAGATLDVDAVLIEQTTATSPTYFDGSFVNAASVMYAWTGAANASTSTAKTYTPALALVAKTDAPCPRVEVTITDLTPTTNTVTIWRTADGKRQAVRGARKRDIVGSDFVTDYEVPLGRLVSYEIEVVSGLNAQVSAPAQAVTVNSTTGYIQDPLMPGSAVAISVDALGAGKATLQGDALRALEYAADMSVINILGSPDPVAIMGQRMAAAGVDMSMMTDAAQDGANLRNLLKQAPLVLVRPLPGWGASLASLCYLAVSKPIEIPIDAEWGGSLIRWELNGDLVAAPTMNVLVPLWTYGDVKALWGTYQQAQTALSGRTYLDVLKSPAGT